MNIIKTAIGLVFAYALAGCQTADQRSSKAETVPENSRHPAELSAGASSPAGGYNPLPEKITLPADRRITANYIEVTVQGSVASSGTFKVKEGSTFLEAIARAGGFSPDAYRKKIMVTKSSGTRLTLYLRTRAGSNNKSKGVWYDVTSPEGSVEEVHDYLIEPGDSILVFQINC